MHLSTHYVEDNDTSHCHNVSKHDVRTAITKLKPDKMKCFSNNCINGTDLLHRHLSILFASMINHGYAPAEFLKSSTLSLPKGARADLSNSDMCHSMGARRGGKRRPSPPPGKFKKRKKKEKKRRIQISLKEKNVQTKF